MFIRYLAKSPVVQDSQPENPRLEDLYLWLFPRKRHMERKVCEMRVFTAELKRLLKTRSILILMLAALLLAPVLAYFPASFASWTYKDDSGQKSGRKERRL